MKIHFLFSALVALTIAVPLNAHAQGRHDEKPHGMQKKPAPKAADSTPSGGPMGRHDERPHGPRKPAASNADAQPSAEAAKK